MKELLSPLFKNEEEYKDYLLSLISSKKMFGYLAYFYKFEETFIETPNDKKIEEWKKILKKKNLNDLKKDLYPFITAGSFTTNIFLINECCAHQLRKNFRKQAVFDFVFAQLDDYYPDIIYNSEKVVIIKLFYPQNETYSLIRKVEEQIPKLTHLITYEEVFIVFRMDKKIIEIRSADERTIRTLERKISEIFKITLVRLYFNREEIFKVINWATITNSNIRFESGTISSSRFTSVTNADGSRADLKNAKLFQEALEKGNIVNVYINIPEREVFQDFPLKKERVLNSEKQYKESEEEIENKSTIGFNINFQKGKIFFQSHIPEIYAWKIINSILGYVTIEDKLIECKKDHSQTILTEFNLNSKREDK